MAVIESLPLPSPRSDASEDPDCSGRPPHLPEAVPRKALPFHTCDYAATKCNEIPRHSPDNPPDNSPTSPRQFVRQFLPTIFLAYFRKRNSIEIAQKKCRQNLSEKSSTSVKLFVGKFVGKIVDAHYILRRENCRFALNSLSKKCRFVLNSLSKKLSIRAKFFVENSRKTSEQMTKRRPLLLACFVWCVTLSCLAPDSGFLPLSHTCGLPSATKRGLQVVATTGERRPACGTKTRIPKARWSESHTGAPSL